MARIPVNAGKYAFLGSEALFVIPISFQATRPARDHNMKAVSFGFHFTVNKLGYIRIQTLLLTQGFRG